MLLGRTLQRMEALRETRAPLRTEPIPRPLDRPQEAVDSTFVASDLSKHRLERAARCRKRQPRAPEMVGRKENDPLVAPARGAAKATRNQVCRNEVVRNGDSGSRAGYRPAR